MTIKDIEVPQEILAREFLTNLIIVGNVAECEKYEELIGEMFSENWSIVTTNLILVFKSGELLSTIDKRKSLNMLKN
ncbi:hypothetical protein [Vibrio sp. C8]